MTQQEFKRRFECSALPLGLASQTLLFMYKEGVSSKDAINCGMKYAVVKEPGKCWVGKVVIGYTTTFADAQALMRQSRDEEISNEIYRNTELRYDTSHWCKVKTVMRGTGEINTYDFCIINIPYVLEQFENQPEGYHVENVRKEERNS
jgi:hypothetical protein